MSDKIYNPFSLKGHTVLVTGASSGIGRATAIECSRMGATVIATGRNAERLASTFAELDGDGHQQIAADLTADEDIERVVGMMPQLDGAVLCAGKGVLIPLKFAKRQKFDDVFEINFFSQIELLRLLVKKKKFNKGASVAVIDSIGGNSSFTTGNIVYGSSKAALQSAMRYCALELAPNVRVNCICPGMVETPLISGATVDADDRRRDEAQYPMGRYGAPVEVAQCAVYLLSNAASWVTGQSFVIDGGFSINH